MAPRGSRSPRPAGTTPSTTARARSSATGRPSSFQTVRTQLKSAIALRRLRFRHIGAVRQTSSGYTQDFDYSGKTRRGRLFKGEIELGYAPLFDQYCVGSALAKQAPAEGYAKSIKVLRAVWANTFYVGSSA